MEERRSRLRAAIHDHLYAFRRYSGQNFFCLNLAAPTRSLFLRRVKFDLIVFHTTFLAQRWNRANFQQLAQRAEFLKQLPGVKVALPQDEFINTHLLCRFFNDFKVPTRVYDR